MLPFTPSAEGHLDRDCFSLRARNSTLRGGRAATVYNAGMDSKAGGNAVDGPRRFHTTRWSIVLAAQAGDPPEARDALEQLCQTYWYPLYAYVRRRGHPAHDAQDLTQEFFATLLEKDYLESADRRRGHFQTFLLTAVSRFLSKQNDRSRAAKRGGGKKPLALDLLSGEQRYRREPADVWTAERLFERRWALTLLETVLARLAERYAAERKADLFERLRGSITGDAGVSYAQTAASLGMTEGAVKVAVHRLKRRYRETLREEIAATVESPDEIDDELNQRALPRLPAQARVLWPGVRRRCDFHDERVHDRGRDEDDALSGLPPGDHRQRAGHGGRPRQRDWLADWQAGVGCTHSARRSARVQAHDGQPWSAGRRSRDHSSCSGSKGKSLGVIEGPVAVDFLADVLIGEVLQPGTTAQPTADAPPGSCEVLAGELFGTDGDFDLGARRERNADQLHTALLVDHCGRLVGVHDKRLTRVNCYLIVPESRAAGNYEFASAPVDR